MTRHLHVHVSDGREASVTWKQFIRKLESGEWKHRDGTTPTRGQAVYYVEQATEKRGVHNFVGRQIMVSIIMTPEEAKEEKAKEEADKLAYIRGIRERQMKPKD